MLCPMSLIASRPATRWILPLLADLVCVLAFAFGGKSSHEASDSNWVVLVIVWPYAAAVVAAHARLIIQKRWAGRLWPEGAIVLLMTYVFGMLLRVGTGRGIDGAFLLVAIAFLTATMLGWRAVVQIVARRNNDSRPSRSA